MDIVVKHEEVISAEQRSAISHRYKRITRAINRVFWGTESETAHSFYVGSYGRGTAINTSDIDILVELPRDVYNQYDRHEGNGQSRLLQTVKNAILDIFPRSDVRGDGQVVIIRFADGISLRFYPPLSIQIYGEIGLKPMIILILTWGGTGFLPIPKSNN